MKLLAYRILFDAWSNTPQFTNDLYNNLKSSPTMKDMNNWKYIIGELYKEDNFIYGVLGQEADELLFEYDDNKNRIELEENRWYDTFFVIDVSTSNLYVHKYKYKPKNLDHKKTIKRFEEILSKVLFKDYKTLVQIMPYREGLSPNEYKRIFYKYKIHETKFIDIKGNFIPEGTELHNPKKVLDDIRRQSHNTYDANILSNAVLEAIEGQNLSKSPTARSFLESNSTGEKITYTNDLGERVTEYKEAKASLQLDEDIEKYTVKEIFTLINGLLKRKADKIKRFKLFENVNEIFNITVDDEEDNNNE